jgi:hypothetical protein
MTKPCDANVMLIEAMWRRSNHGGEVTSGLVRRRSTRVVAEAEQPNCLTLL